MRTVDTIVTGCGFDRFLLSRIEDASLNASAPQQQRWLDGWLLRYAPGKARRSRCINAVAHGRLPWQQKVVLAHALYREMQLPMLIRITPFTLPRTLDAALSDAGHAAIDPTCVMVRPSPGARTRSHRTSETLPAVDGEPNALVWVDDLTPGDFAAVIGAMRASSAEQIAAHAARMLQAPVPARRLALARADNGTVLACGQSVREGEMVGLYDIHTLANARKQGLAALICERLLTESTAEGGHYCYLQVEADNAVAQRLYVKMGFRPAYGYHYRELA